MSKLRQSGKWRGSAYASNFWFRDAPAVPLTVGEKIGVGIVLAMFALMALVGLLALWAGISQYAAGVLPLGNALGAIGLGLVFSTIGLGFFYYRYVKKPLLEAEKRRLEHRYPGQPWMLRSDWASRRVVHSDMGLMLMLWFWNLGWWGGLAFIGYFNHQKIQLSMESSWWAYLLLAFFLFCGLAVLRLAVDATWSYWRYGRSTLRLDTLPAYTGERLRATLEARFAARPAVPLKASLVCDKLHWRRYRSGGKTQTRLEVKEQRRVEKDISPNSVLVSRGSARIPIEFDVPAGYPEYSIDGEGNGIRWTLHVETAKGETPPFVCTFEVPVYARRG